MNKYFAGIAATAAALLVSGLSAGAAIGNHSASPALSCLSGSNVTQILGNSYHLQSNEWNSSAPFTICQQGNAEFRVTNSGINLNGGAPGAYPSLYKGCHWGYCTSNSGLPVKVSALTTGRVTTTYNTYVTNTGAYDDAYDNWFNPATSTSNNATGMEMMIWLNHNGSIQPAGSKVASGVSIGGRSYDVWRGGSTPGGIVSYVMTSPATNVYGLDMGPLARDAVNRGYMTSAWYLIDVEAGFEIWNGGLGLRANSLMVCTPGC